MFDVANEAAHATSRQLAHWCEPPATGDPAAKTPTLRGRAPRFKGGYAVPRLVPQAGEANRVALALDKLLRQLRGVKRAQDALDHCQATSPGTYREGLDSQAPQPVGSRRGTARPQCRSGPSTGLPPRSLQRQCWMRSRPQLTPRSTNGLIRPRASACVTGVCERAPTTEAAPRLPGSRMVTRRPRATCSPRGCARPPASARSRGRQRRRTPSALPPKMVPR